MANETLNAKGSYATAQAATSTTDGSLCPGSVTAISAAIASEDLYTLLDFQVIMSLGTPASQGEVNIFRRASDGTNNSSPPVAADYQHKPVGTVVFDDIAATTYAYLYGVPNPDDGDQYYMISELGATCTIELKVRGRTYGTA
jgi:hypothetical protein